MTLPLHAAAVLAATLLLSRALRPAAHRRDLLTVGALLVLALPLLDALPAARVLPTARTVVQAMPPVLHPVGLTLQEPAGSAPWLPSLTLLWWLGVAASLVAALRRLAPVVALSARQEDLDADWVAACDVVDCPVPIAAHAGLTSPVVLPGLRPRILVPAQVDWPHARRVRALRHELGHVTARDDLRALLGEVLVIVLWYQPLAWWWRNAQRTASEQAADAAAVAHGADPVELAGDLVQLGRTLVGLPGLGSPPLEQRVRSLLAPRPRPRPLRTAAAIGALGFVGVALTTVRPAHADPPEDWLRDELARIDTQWSPEAAAIAVVDLETGASQAMAFGRNEGWTPGSVVKPFVAAAALQRGLVPDEASLAHQLEVSDNDSFVALATAVGAPLSGDLEAMGLPAPAASAADLALGQFPMTTTELAQAYARLPDHPHGHRVIQHLVRVVEGDRGTGRQAAVQGLGVAGKTGTSLLDADDPTRVLASFVGLVPADDPRWAIAVQVAGPEPRGWGGSVAAPSFARLAAQLR